MRTISFFPTLLIIPALFITGCRTASYSSANQAYESTELVVAEKMDVVSYATLRSQMAPSLAERAGMASSGNRGLLSTAISLGTNIVKQMIARDRAKYTAGYSFGVTDMYFYDQLSTNSVFDPIGMQFNGFTLVRTFMNKQNQLDTALKAEFELDKDNPSEIINNSMFRLKLKDIDLDYAKAKVTKAQQNSINMDIEITFTTSYVNEQGQLFDNVELGKFFLLLRNAPLDKNNPAYARYYDSLRGTSIDGRSFIVPRSFGYYKTESGEVNRSYSQGAYSISAKVTETSRDKFITKVLMDNSSKLIDLLGTGAKRLDR
jgi:hypothetical protein